VISATSDSQQRSKKFFQIISTKDDNNSVECVMVVSFSWRESYKVSLCMENNLICEPAGLEQQSNHNAMFGF